MAEDRTVGQSINTWLQSIALVLAAGWGCYTFWYEKISTPKAAVNISIKLSLKKLDVPNKTTKRPHSLVPIELTVFGTNASQRTIYLLSNAWVAYGRNVHAHTYDNITTFCQDAINSLNSNSTNIINKHAKLSSMSLIATGNIFEDKSLRPNETITRTLLFYVNQNDYDSVSVTTAIPSITTQSSGINVSWTALKSNIYNVDFLLRPKLYRIEKSECAELPKDTNGVYIDDKNGLQTASARYTIGIK